MARLVAALLSLFAFALAGPVLAQDLPRLRTQGDAVQLIVKGEPFLILGGETGNSTTASLDYMAAQWETLEALNLNTVVAPVYWELIEPSEGTLDFSTVDGLIEQARDNDMKLVLLWFGTWKNSMSTYVPGWVKRDDERFPRAKDETGRSQEILSPFSEAVRDADADAFAALMAHLERTDRRQNTVIMVQVENEIGMLPNARSHEPAADAAWAGQVPDELMDYISANRSSLQEELVQTWMQAGGRASGTWAEVFGEDLAGQEIFIAWHFARFADYVAAAGVAEYDLPVYVNAALNRPGALPGQYPSGGPLPHLIDVWRAGAPSIDFLAPDIYFEDYTYWIPRYDVPGNAVFIPEANRAGRPEAAADALFSFGALDAIGFSPFSIESIEEPADNPLAEVYEMLANMDEIILAHQGMGAMMGLRPDVAYDGTVDETSVTVSFGDIAMKATFVDPWTPKDSQDIASHGGLIIQTGPEEFIVAGKGMTLTFPDRENGTLTGIESAQEGRFVDNEWRGGRWLNGDQTHQGRHIRLAPDAFSIQQIRLYSYR